ncbi:MAG: putative ligase-like protein [Planctomycetaceae bacterium]|nr:putative ligase-like protein [Planctomycetaceae bacterium]
MSLVDYQRKRNFTQTAEPPARTVKKHGSQFVIQKHAASHLHYDFRLEMDGVLKSWAVPHGPSLDPSQKRLAVEVEDHPLAYATFEGTIPAGQYGGGTVMVWDRGTWSAVGDAEAGYRDGKLKFVLEGEKLHGGWTLVRMRAREGEKRHNWLLIKERDSDAVPLAKSDILEARPESVATGRSMDEISGGEEPSPRAKKHPAGSKRAQPRSTSGRVKSSFPEVSVPELATLVAKPPDGPDWLHEVKFDGYRILCHFNKGQAILRSRSQLDWTHRFPEIAKALEQLEARQAVIDGEIVAEAKNGLSSFQDLQVALTEHATQKLRYYVFDLLYLDGYDLRGLPLAERRRQLQELVGTALQPHVNLSHELKGSGEEVFRQCAKHGWEGVVSKRRDSLYKGGRGGQWLKAKWAQRDEFVIGGFTDSTSTHKSMGALLLGYYDNQKQLTYAGKVGTGFSEAALDELHAALVPLERKTCPFAAESNPESTSRTHWVRPQLVAQIAYSNMTRDGRLRHSVYHGLREDKPAASVVRDTPQAVQSTAPVEAATRPNRKSSKKTKTSSAKLANHSAPVDPPPEVGTIELTHPERIMYPAEGITKLHVATYYAEIVEWILPHIADRPLSLLRCPEGQGGPSFYQKHASAGMSSAVRQIPIKEANKTDIYLAINNLDGLLSLIQMGVLEIHPWGTTTDDLEHPDRMIFDFDPDPAVKWPQVVTAAQQLRDRLQALGLESFVKTTGGKGLHVVVPLSRRNDWTEVKEFSKSIANQIVADAPDDFTATMSKSARAGKIFIDYLRNTRGATAIAPYSTRARKGAPVAMPLSWDELTAKTEPGDYNINTTNKRLSALKKDPWNELTEIRQSITAAMRRKLGTASAK